MLSAIANPTAFDSPWDNGPVVVSIPSNSPYSGWPAVGDLSFLKFLILENKCKPGIVFNPATPLSYLEHCIDKIDMILIMSVNPGFPGQKFIESTLEKIKKVREIIDNSKREIRLEVDGGVTLENIGKIAKSGADTFVAGSAIFGSNDYKKTISTMRSVLSEVWLIISVISWWKNKSF